MELQCGCVLLLIWKMTTLLDFFGSKFCEECECVFGQRSKMDTSGIRKKGLSERNVRLLENHIKGVKQSSSRCPIYRVATMPVKGFVF